MNAWPALNGGRAKAGSKGSFFSSLQWNRKSPFSQRLGGAAAVAVILMCPGLHACADEAAVWTEEVETSGAKVVTVRRRATLGEARFPIQSRGLPKSWELCYEPLKAYWKSAGPYEPKNFDIFEGVVHVTVPLGGCVACSTYLYPSTSALYFKFENGKWNQTPSRTLPNGPKQNLLANVWHAQDKSQDPSGHITLADKKERDSFLYTPYGIKAIRDQQSFCAVCEKNVPTLQSDFPKIAPESKSGDSFCIQ